jgi:signal transduction histidine kinase
VVQFEAVDNIVFRTLRHEIQSMSAPAEPDKSWGATGSTGGARWPVAAGVALALAVLAVAISISLLHLRKQIFEQIANRDGETLDALAAQQFLVDKDNESITTLSDTGEQIQLAFEITRRLQNVIGVRLFSPKGEFVTADPAWITEASLSWKDLDVLRTGRPVSHFVPRAHPEEYDLLADTNSPPVPLLEINIALREDGTNRIAGIAQFLMNGTSIAAENAQIDAHLVAQGALTFAISGTIVTAGFLLAFGRVQRANALLAERTNNLLKANRQLTLAAKTSAIGAVTSHLIHGLKNPLSGLKSFVQERAHGEESGQNTDWQLAMASTQRMQMLIDRVVRVLQEQQMVVEYQISFAELLEMIASEVRPVAQAARVKFTSSLDVNGVVSNREADLILLILENLIQNAIEATPPGKAVYLRVRSDPAHVLMEVQDEGPGLSPELAGRLFTPCLSPKKGGSGIGLTISRQLAVHLGASLELIQSPAAGCCFRLTLPLHVSFEGAKRPEPDASERNLANRSSKDKVFAGSDPQPEP